MTSSIAVVGSLNLDIVVPVARHPRPGETVLGGDSVRTPGGKGANQAVAAARLGGDVVMIGRVGADDAGRQLKDALAEAGLEAGHVAVTEGVPTGIALIAVDAAGENTIVVSPGANAHFSSTDVEAAVEAIGDAAVTVLQLEVPVAAVIAAAQASPGVVILNPAPAQEVPDELLDGVDVLVPNRGELGALLGEEAPDDLDAIAALARRFEEPATVVVTLGSQGALVVDATDALHIKPFEVTPVDTTAAGDAFCGALAEAFARGESIEAAARWAAAAGALAVTKPGAQASLPTRAEVEELVRS